MGLFNTIVEFLHSMKEQRSIETEVLRIDVTYLSDKIDKWNDILLKQQGNYSSFIKVK